MSAEIGEKAPGSTLPADDWETVSLEEYTQEGPATLLLYPGDWSSVCTDQMSRSQEEFGRFESLGAKVLAISADTPWSYLVFGEDQSIESLLTGFGGDVIEDYGVRHEPSLWSQPELGQVLEDLEKAL